MIEHILTTDRGKVHYWQSADWEQGRKTLFFLHGLTADHRMFRSQVEFFRKEYNLLVWDAPGHGRSRPFCKFCFREAADYMHQILLKSGAISSSVPDLADCDEPGKHLGSASGELVLIGQSLGGYLAQAYIKRHPGTVDAFISIDSTPYGEGYYSALDRWILRQVEWMAMCYPLKAMKREMAKQVSTTQVAYDNMMEMLADYGKRELCHLMGLGYAGFLEDNSEINLPKETLLILGEKDRTGKVARYNQAWTERTGYPLRIVKNAAHNANVDQPEQVNRLIEEFLEAK